MSVDPHKYRLLVVDDESLVTEIISFHLQEHGFEVDTLTHPDDILPTLEQGHYDLLITDYMMPNDEGRVVIETLRSMARFKTLPIIVVTAKVLTLEDREFFINSKALVVTKPFDAMVLFEKVCEALR